ncbi:hypothetical protein DFJ74DRAFT_318528 [Hyaloraphidium curvatum]|nr:hypothetical protein DFJ74DRAFT_318528 [Hyaloraphidium curvatum]
MAAAQAPNATAYGAAARRAGLRVAIVGGGVAGIGMAYRLREAGFASTTIFEQSAGLGGTWLDARYPNCGLDNEAHAYTFRWAPNPHWKSTYADRDEVLDYLNNMAQKHGVHGAAKFGRKLKTAEWDSERVLWKLEFDVVRTEFRDVRGRALDGAAQKGVPTLVPTGVTEEVEAEWLISCSGSTNRPVIPKIEGAEEFQGISMHTARWDTSFDHTKPLDSETGTTRIVVIGTGSSGAQLVPELARYPHNHITVVQRTTGSIVPKFANRPYTEAQRAAWAADPASLEACRQSFLAPLENFESAFKVGSWAQWILRTATDWYTWWQVKDRETYLKLRNKYAFACGRPVFDENYLASFNLSNVKLASGSPARTNARSIVLDSGAEIPCDLLVWATGYVSNYTNDWTQAAFGRTHAELWESGLRVAHLHSVMTCGMPNFAFLNGPNLPTVPFAYGCDAHARYIVRLVSRCADLAEGGKGYPALQPTAAAQEAHMAFLRKVLEGTTFMSGCGSRFNQEKPGSFPTAVHPLSYKKVEAELEAPSDWEREYEVAWPGAK